MELIELSNLKIFTDNIEDEALIQVNRLLQQDAFKNSKVRIMPDVHAGKSCVIGFTGDLGEKVIIPINMRDGCIIGVGKGNPDWNYSAPHGAGRVMSRAKAKELINLEEYKKTMSNIYTTSVNEETKDEAPFAYKSLEEILNHIIPTIDVINVIKPVYNFKASGVQLFNIEMNEQDIKKAR